MSYLYILLLVLTCSCIDLAAFASEAKSGEGQNEVEVQSRLWKRCNNDNECVLVVSDCPGVTAVNLRYRTIAENYYVSNKGHVNCEEWIDLGIKFRPLCEKHFCEVNNER